MEVLDESCATLSNQEVYAFLLDTQSGPKRQKKARKTHENLATISYSTIKYLEKTPCKLQSDDIVRTLMLALQPFGLTKAEKLQVLNHRPQTAVEIQVMIEESEERLTEEQIDQLLDVISSCLPGDDPPEAEQPEHMDQQT